MTSARALLLAALLGPASYGVLGTLVLTQQYLSYVALGVREGLTVKLAQSQADSVAGLEFSSSALAWALGVGVLILLGSTVLANRGPVLNRDWILVGVIACLSVTNEMLININRDRSRILKVALLELAFNAAPLSAALFLGRDITVTVVLVAMAVGLSVSVVGQALGGNLFSIRHVSARATRDLLRSGIPLALLSFATNSMTGIFVFAASAMSLGRTVGLLVFANSLCTIILYGLNMAAWAATSQSMKRIFVTNSDNDAGARSARLTDFFRLGVILATSCLLGVQLVFLFAMKPYAGSEVFAVYMCLLQSYGLLLYRELNFLAVRSRSLVVAAGYAVILLIIAATARFAPGIGMVHLLQISLGLLCVFSLCCVYYCRRLGFLDSHFRRQLAFLSFPPCFALGFAMSGWIGGILVGAAFTAAWLYIYRLHSSVLLAGMMGGRTP